jgi:hypothetical protein
MYSASTINGQPSWTSVTSQYLIYWNTGSTPSQWIMTGYPLTSLINYDPTYPPLSNWQILGSPTVLNMTVLTGICSTAYTVNNNIVANDAICNQQGSITINTNNGVSPYQYSINTGQSYQASPIFNNLQPGTYYVLAKDSNNVTSIITPIIINATQPITYTVTLSVNYANDTFSVSAQTLPVGVSISFDLVHTSNLFYYPNTMTPIPSYNNFATITGVGPLLFYSTLTGTQNIPGPCTQVNSPSIQNQIYNTYYSAVTLTSGQIIYGTVTDQITNFIAGYCKSVSGTYVIQAGNPQIKNCDCCIVKIDTPVN